MWWHHSKENVKCCVCFSIIVKKKDGSESFHSFYSLVLWIFLFFCTCKMIQKNIFSICNRELELDRLWFLPYFRLLPYYTQITEKKKWMGYTRFHFQPGGNKGREFQGVETCDIALHTTQCFTAVCQIKENQFYPQDVLQNHFLHLCLSQKHTHTHMETHIDIIAYTSKQQLLCSRCSEQLMCTHTHTCTK